MYEYVKLAGRSSYIQSPAKIGVYELGDGDVLLIDSGNDKDAGRRVKKILEANSFRLRAIVNTHSNADHIGGNRTLQQQTGCKIYAAGIETAFTRYPVLEPSFLYGGYPCRDLRHKFLLAEGSDVLDITDESFPKELEVIPLPGHFFDMIGLRTPDDVVFLADCISSAATLEKYKIPFIYDIASYLDTLDRVEKLEAAFFVPAHAEASEDVRELVSINRRCVLEIAEKIASFCAEPLPFEELLRRLFSDYGLTMNFEQYVLVGSTVRSYLSWMKDTGRLDGYFEDNRLLWRAKG